MRRKFAVFIGAAAIAVAMAVNVGLGLKSNAKFDLFLANVNALGQTECWMAYGWCSDSCPYEFCGWCEGVYLQECPTR